MNICFSKKVLEIRKRANFEEFPSRPIGSFPGERRKQEEGGGEEGDNELAVWRQRDQDGSPSNHGLTPSERGTERTEDTSTLIEQGSDVPTVVHLYRAPRGIILPHPRLWLKLNEDTVTTTPYMMSCGVTTHVSSCKTLKKLFKRGGFFIPPRLLLPREGGLHQGPLERRLQAPPVRLRVLQARAGLRQGPPALHVRGRAVRPRLLRGQLVGAAGVQQGRVQGLVPLGVAGKQVSTCRCTCCAGTPAVGFT